VGLSLPGRRGVASTGGGPIPSRIAREEKIRNCPATASFWVLWRHKETSSEDFSSPKKKKGQKRVAGEREKAALAKNLHLIFSTHVAQEPPSCRKRSKKKAVDIIAISDTGTVREIKTKRNPHGRVPKKIVIKKRERHHQRYNHWRHRTLSTRWTIDQLQGNYTTIQKKKSGTKLRLREKRKETDESQRRAAKPRLQLSTLDGGVRKATFMFTGRMSGQTSTSKDSLKQKRGAAPSRCHNFLYTPGKCRDQAGTRQGEPAPQEGRGRPGRRKR